MSCTSVKIDLSIYIYIPFILAGLCIRYTLAKRHSLSYTYGIMQLYLNHIGHEIWVLTGANRPLFLRTVRGRSFSARLLFRYIVFLRYKFRWKTSAILIFLNNTWSLLQIKCRDMDSNDVEAAALLQDATSLWSNHIHGKVWQSRTAKWEKRMFYFFVHSLPSGRPAWLHFNAVVKNSSAWQFPTFDEFTKWAFLQLLIFVFLLLYCRLL